MAEDVARRLRQKLQVCELEEGLTKEDEALVVALEILPTFECEPPKSTKEGRLSLV